MQRREAHSRRLIAAGMISMLLGPADICPLHLAPMACCNGTLHESE